MIFKKIAATVSALALSAGMAAYMPANTAVDINANAADVEVNYAEALQKSMFFYEVQQAGILPEWNSVSWRADSMIKEDGTPSDIIDGGWFDAGDHLKFALTNAYTASVLSWGLIEYKDAVQKAGLYDLYLKNLKWGLDYVAACDLGDKVIGTIGEDGFDHVWYGSPEVYMRKFNLKNDTEERPYDTITNCTTIAEMAAAMAGGYIVFKDEDPKAAKEYLEHAESLFKLANDVWAENGADANKDQGIQGKYYNTINNQGTDNFIDELMYAANWMYMATGDQSYLDKCEKEYIPLFPKESQSTDMKYTWGFCWDDTTQAAALLYAINTGKKEWIDHVSHHLDYMIGGYNGKKPVGGWTPDGMTVVDGAGWGTLRYTENAAWLAKLSCDTIFKDNAQLSEKYNTWAKKMMDYAFGDNDLGLSYVVGMGEKNPVNIHHRGASGIHDDYWQELGKEEPEEDDGWQREYAHVLYGALEGGPNPDGTFKDDNGSYVNTEVAIDYNAGYTAALCALLDDYGGEKLADFPQAETPKWAEWKMAASLNGKGNSYTEVKAWVMNHTAWPARVAENIKFRYYFDVSEVLAAGLSVDNITVSIGSQQYQEGKQGHATTTGKPIKYEGDPSGNTYYAEIVFEDGRAIMPTGQSEHRDEVQFRISIPDAVDGKPTTGAWDATNDWSYEGVEDAPNKLELKAAENNHITMYVDDVLVWGTEPDGTKPEVTEPTKPTKPENTNPSGGDKAVFGDADESGDVNINDAVLIMQSIANPDKYKLSKQGKLNADVVDNGGGITNSDALAIQYVESKTIQPSDFPITANELEKL
ncbi:MAG: glycoside hydrolase family 9 protein [Ruminococcus sp.]|nr:glycoside hydrolase family 9 protein [Ruminococcus sp.]